MDSSVDNETLIVLRCAGLGVSAKTNFKNVGVLSNIYLRATGKTASNEKRIIKLSQSAPFKPNINGRPPNSDFTQIYVSELVEDASDVTPSLVASIRCPSELDCSIRLSVYYSSNLTAEKEVLLAGTSFTRKELLRAVHNKGFLVSDMVSEHCPGSKAYVEVMPHMPNVLPDMATVLPSADPQAVRQAEIDHLGFTITSPRSPVNPFKQRYVFYAEDNQHMTPLVHAEESTWEPAFTALLPALFMENFTSALVRSINAWNMRYELERKRQGRFRSLKEAIQHGWHSVNVTVHAARFGATRPQAERVKQQQLMQEQALLVAALAENNHMHQSAGSGGAIHNNNRSSARLRPVSVNPVQNTQSHNQTSHNHHSGNVGGPTGPVLPTYNVCIPVSDETDDEGTNFMVSVSENGGIRGMKGRVLHDDTAPCTFVDVSIEDKSQVFLLPMGRTNTEYYNLNPVYGSNLNASIAGRKAVTAPSVNADCVEICFAEKEHSFYSFDTTDRDGIARNYAQHWQQRRSTKGEHSPVNKRVNSVSNAAATSTQDSAIEGAAGIGVSGTQTGHRGSADHSHSSHYIPHSNPHSNTQNTHSTNSNSHHHSTLQSAHLSSLSMATIPIPPLPPADTIHKVVGKEAHFYRFVSTCAQSAVRFEVCLEDPNNGNRKRIGTCMLPISPGCRKDVWLPVRLQGYGEHGSVEGEFEDVELHVSVSVKSPYDEDQDLNQLDHHSSGASMNNNGSCSNSKDYFNTKPSPAAMPEVLVYQRTVQGPPARADEGKELQQRRSRASTMSFDAGSGGTGTGTMGTSATVPGSLSGTTTVSGTAATIPGAAIGGNSKGGSMDETYKDDSGMVNSVAANNAELDDYRATLADAYEWMWYVGFNGTDPLVLDKEATRVGSGKSSSGIDNDSKRRSKSTNSTSATTSSRPTSTNYTHPTSSTSQAHTSTPDVTAMHANTTNTALSLDHPQTLPQTTTEAEEEVLEHDFQEHFESSRMSVFASSDHIDTLSSYVPDQLPVSGGTESGLILAEVEAQVEANANIHIDGSSKIDASSPLIDTIPADAPIVESADMINWVESFAPFQDVHSPTPARLNDTEAIDSGTPPTAPHIQEAMADVISSNITTDATTGLVNVPTHFSSNPIPATTSVATPLTTPRTVPHIPISPPSSPPCRHAKRARVDFNYPLEWIRSHVEAMEALAMELGSLVPLMKTAHKEHKSFRASALKKQAEWQALPVNLHYQLMSVRPYCPMHTGTTATTGSGTGSNTGGGNQETNGSDGVDKEKGNKVRTEVVHSVTCGAMTPHMLGHKKGGLYYQESKLVNSKVELDREKNAFIEKQRMAGNTGIPTTATEPFGVYKRLQELGEKTLQFESVCLSICHRRAYAISQSLSIAVNSLLLKLGLTIQGAIPERVAEQWLHCGVLLVFEGLLSVVAHERSMLEDTISAVDALRSFQVRLLPYPDELHLYKNNTSVSGENKEANKTASSGIKSQVERAEADHLNIDNIHISVDEATTAAFTADTENTHNDAHSRNKTNPNTDFVNDAPASDTKRSLKLELRGREVLVYVPYSALRKFPQSYQQAAYHKGGAVIPLYSVLFTQGIDIQQTMVTTFGGDSAQGRTNNLHLQHDVNLKGLRDVNAYCLKALPVSTDALSAHTIASNSGSGSSGGTSGGRSHSTSATTVTPTSSSTTTAAAGPAKRLSYTNNTAMSPKTTHPMVRSLHDTILSSSLTLKNVDLLIEVERLCVMLGGCRITFCKSGKDRTGMACTLDQSRQLGERYGCGMTLQRVLKDANLMRVHGCRLLIAEKNIGRKVYSINRMQAQFLPVMFRPPNQVCEDLLKKDNS